MSLLILSKLSQAQTDVKYQQDYDAKTVRWGFFMGYALTNYDIKFNSKYLAPVNAAQFYAITSPTTTVLKAGALVNVQLNDYFDLRFSPLSLAIYKRKLLVNGTQDNEENSKAWFEFPVILKYKSERRKNSRMFIFTGLKYGKETNATGKKKGVALAQTYVTKTSDLTLEFGMGLDLFREYFKYSPEIHFSHGMVNLANPYLTSDQFLSYVSKLRSNTVSFLITF